MKKTILEYLQEKGISVNAVCGGRRQCGRCIVKIQRTLPITQDELRLLSDEQISQGYRLACMHEYQDGDIIEPLHDEMKVEDAVKEEREGYRFRQGYGLIMDLGTTTVSMKWVDLSAGKIIHSSSFMNPQRSFGADVISRIQAARDRKDALHACLIEKIEKEILKADIGISTLILAGNTVMTHFFLNEDVQPLGVYPFDIPVKNMKRLDSSLLFHLPYAFEVITFPHIAAYVGGDITAGIYALDLDCSRQPVLFMDLGTNGELAYCSQQEMTASSTAAGPAFEGSGIRWGGGCIPGAISAVRLKPLSLQVIDDIRPVCICGSGIISLTAEMVRHQQLEHNGRMKETIHLSEEISFDQQDMQNVQLAKAAVQTGVRILCEEKPVAKIIIAGGFGKGIDPEDLRTIGVLPQGIPAENAGNTSLAGCMKLLMKEEYERVERIAENTKSIDLAMMPDFQDRLIDSLYF